MDFALLLLTTPWIPPTAPVAPGVPGVCPAGPPGLGGPNALAVPCDNPDGAWAAVAAAPPRPPVGLVDGVEPAAGFVPGTGWPEIRGRKSSPVIGSLYFL